jgi:hypothetical protein
MRRHDPIVAHPPGSTERIPCGPLRYPPGVTWFGDLLNRLRGPRPSAPTTTPGPVARPPVDGSPGQYGADRTVEVPPRSIGQVRMSYAPITDGDPDPGEIVWTWVPFEENDGRGKDRPVLVVAAERSGTLLAVQLTSKPHQGADFVPVGAGAWDGEHRPSWVRIDRVLRVHPTGMRREASALDQANYARVEGALRQRYGWR